jgi:hypothetical protein
VCGAASAAVDVTPVVVSIATFATLIMGCFFVF